MKFVIQRVTEAKVEVDQKTVGAIDRGYMILVGINATDTKEIMDKMLNKLLKLRINADNEGKTNLSLSDVDGSLLIVSQFTLYADCRKGNRPSFVKAGAPAHAEALYEYMIQKCREENYHVEHGIFGADMAVSLVNDGPFTIVLDSEELGF